MVRGTVTVTVRVMGRVRGTVTVRVMVRGRVYIIFYSSLKQNTMADQILPKGLRMFNKHEKAPDFVIGTLVVTPDDLNAFCIDNETLMTEYNGSKQLKVQILRSKDGELYCAVDTYKPGIQAAPAHAPGPMDKPAAALPEDDNSLPF